MDIKNETYSGSLVEVSDLVNEICNGLSTLDLMGADIKPNADAPWLPNTVRLVAENLLAKAEKATEILEELRKAEVSAFKK